MIDMDIEMDIDLGITEEADFMVPDNERMVEDTAPAQYVQNGVAPNDTSGPDALEPTPDKVHLRGLDNLTTNDIKTFASEYVPDHTLVRIEWIDDTSANLVYESPEVARIALQSFSASDASQITSLQTVPAKPFPAHPDTHLEVRIAVIGDRKQAGARDRSRFYLMNPKYDPGERRGRGSHRGGNKYRDRDDGGYRSQRYDAREDQKRRAQDESAGFDASLYDDDEAALVRRTERNNRPGSSGSDSRERGGRRVKFGGVSKELFPDRDRGVTGRLRDRSASPTRDYDGDRDMDVSQDRKRDTAAAANRLKAQKIKEQLRLGSTTKELFPKLVGIQHRRSDAFDAADETADLFSSRMPVPFMDGSSDDRRLTAMQDSELGRFNIRGNAKASATYDFAIKGTAPTSVKELFPTRANTGKELFSDRLEGRGLRRQKAGDLFD